jgi:hypothetical protein
MLLRSWRQVWVQVTSHEPWNIYHVISHSAIQKSLTSICLIDNATIRCSYCQYQLGFLWHQYKDVEVRGGDTFAFYLLISSYDHTQAEVLSVVRGQALVCCILDSLQYLLCVIAAGMVLRICRNDPLGSASSPDTIWHPTLLADLYATSESLNHCLNWQIKAQDMTVLFCSIQHKEYRRAVRTHYWLTGIHQVGFSPHHRRDCRAGPTILHYSPHSTTGPRHYSVIGSSEPM